MNRVLRKEGLCVSREVEAVKWLRSLHKREAEKKMQARLLTEENGRKRVTVSNMRQRQEMDVSS